MVKLLKICIPFLIVKATYMALDPARFFQISIVSEIKFYVKIATKKIPEQTATIQTPEKHIL